VLLAGAIAMWAIWQPERSSRAADSALAHLDAGRLAQARSDAVRAREINPVSSRALLVRASVESAAGRPDAALALLRSAVVEQPNDPDLWLALARFQLNRLNRPRDALESVAAAIYVDPLSQRPRDLFLGIQARLRIEAEARRTAADSGATKPSTDDVIP
jgi:tetratricopeptide (TPR) repeat protein